MNTEVRFLLAMGLMLAVLIGTNLLFPPIEEEPVPALGGRTTLAVDGFGGVRGHPRELRADGV